MNHSFYLLFVIFLIIIIAIRVIVIVTFFNSKFISPATFFSSHKIFLSLVILVLLLLFSFPPVSFFLLAYFIDLLYRNKYAFLNFFECFEGTKRFYFFEKCFEEGLASGCLEIGVTESLTDYFGKETEIVRVVKLHSVEYFTHQQFIFYIYFKYASSTLESKLKNSASMIKE